MLISEDFLRCPSCNSAYFKEEFIVTINKASYGKEEIKAKRGTKVYTCIQCKEVLKDPYLGDV